jgi:hypothetical protein
MRTDAIPEMCRARYDLPKTKDVRHLHRLGPGNYRQAPRTIPDR